jgi:hypothetical protein
MKIINCSNSIDHQRHIILDLEYRADEQLYQRYRIADPRPAPCRWPFRRVVSGSVMAIRIDEGVWQVEDFRSFSGGDDRLVVRQLFNWFQERPTHALTTYGGANEDLQILKMAAMEHGFILPPQLRQNERNGRDFFHTDLALVLRGGGGQFAHMTELATRHQLPGKLAGSAGQVHYLAAEQSYKSAARISECDVLTTALLLASHLATLGQVKSMFAAHYVTMMYVREYDDAAPYHRFLGNYLARAKRQMMDEQQAWLLAS